MQFGGIAQNKNRTLKQYLTAESEIRKTNCLFQEQLN